VLIVDDDPSVREYLRILLEQAGYSAMSVDDGRTALAYLARVRADVILLDLMMPHVDGWTFVEAMQANRELSRIPIIVFSGSLDGALPGVAATLVKPSTPDTLLETIERVLAGDRRRNPRFAAHFDLRATGPSAAIQTTTLDVSRGGLSFDSAVAPRVGERLRLTVELTVHGAATMEVEVRHVARAAVGWRVGAELLELETNAAGFNAELELLALSAAD
jgi:DNA-binding response OmpR family regulator